VRTRTEIGVILSQHLECALPRTASEIDERREWIARLWIGVVDTLGANRDRWSNDLSCISDDAWADILSESDSQDPKPEEFPERLETSLCRGRVDAARTHLESNQAIFDWLEASIGRKVRRELNLTYIYYKRPGQVCGVHIDHESVFPYNCLIGLRHQPSSSGEMSCLRLYMPQSYDDIVVPVHGAVLFNSSRTPHGRTPIAAGEQVQLLSIGVVPL
jgi:hypothetical protein